VVAPELQSAIERRCGCAARFVQTVPVSVPVGLDDFWDVVVHVFDLEGCEKTNRAYAWSSGSVYTALDIGPIRSPSNAVNAIVADMIRQSRLALWGRGQQAAAA
jgi:hypothetical protein